MFSVSADQKRRECQEKQKNTEEKVKGEDMEDILDSLEGLYEEYTCIS